MLLHTRASAKALPCWTQTDKAFHMQPHFSPPYLPPTRLAPPPLLPVLYGSPTFKQQQRSRDFAQAVLQEVGATQQGSQGGGPPLRQLLLEFLQPPLLEVHVPLQLLQQLLRSSE